LAGKQVKDHSVRLGGLLVQGYRWTLSLRAKVLLLSLLIAISVIIFFGIYPFLAVTHRVDADILVVEGWIGPYAIQFAAKEFNSHR
jgi:hypothetical protein